MASADPVNVPDPMAVSDPMAMSDPMAVSDPMAASDPVSVSDPVATSDPVLGDYVGPLADLVQRVDLSLELASDEAGERMESPRGDVGDLRQMTHMMKRVAAPPPRGVETFDLGELFEERLAVMTIQGPRELRFLPRGERGHTVRADRGAVSEALVSMLALAAGCTGRQGVVRAPYGPDGQGNVVVSLEFPAGPLVRSAAGDVDALLRPGGLGDRVPGLGAADLPAALAVARSQGGDLRLVWEPGERLSVRLQLPLSDAPSTQGGPGPGETGDSGDPRNGAH